MTEDCKKHVFYISFCIRNAAPISKRAKYEVFCSTKASLDTVNRVLKNSFRTFFRTWNKLL